jgi:hypothetical protein
VIVVSSATKGASRPLSTATGLTLRQGAVLTAVAAVLFPRLNAVLHEGQAFWQLDREAAVLIPVIIAATLALFATVGRWAMGSTGRNRTADIALATGVVSVLGIVAFWVSAPIVFGGLASTLGLGGLRRATEEGKATRALAATVLGLFGMAAGAVIWLVGA